MNSTVSVETILITETNSLKPIQQDENSLCTFNYGKNKYLRLYYYLINDVNTTKLNRKQ